MSTLLTAEYAVV